MTGSIRKVLTYLGGFAVAAVASIMILTWAFAQGLPLVMNLFTSNPATVAINDAGLQLTGALDNAVAGGGFTLTGGDGGGISLPSLPSSGGGGLTLPSLPSAGGSVVTLPSLPSAGATTEAAPTLAPTPVVTMMTVSTGGAAHDWAGYTVRPGDSMGSIARRYGVNVADLCGMNVSVTGGNCNLIRTGMQLKLPTANGQAPREIVQVAKPVVQRVNNTPVVVQPTPVPVVKEVVAAGGQTYTIQAGDTIYKIAAKFGGMSKVYGICAANRAVLGDNCDNLQAGAVIVIK